MLGIFNFVFWMMGNYWGNLLREGILLNLYFGKIILWGMVERE